MARNRSEKNPEPVLEGHPEWLMEPIRIDAMRGDKLDGLDSAGDTAFMRWSSSQKTAYMEIDEDVRKDCYDAWLEYYHRNPEKRVLL